MSASPPVSPSPSAGCTVAPPANCNGHGTLAGCSCNCDTGYINDLSNVLAPSWCILSGSSSGDVPTTPSVSPSPDDSPQPGSQGFVHTRLFWILIIAVTIVLAGLGVYCWCRIRRQRKARTVAGKRKRRRRRHLRRTSSDSDSSSSSSGGCSNNADRNGRPASGKDKARRHHQAKKYMEDPTDGGAGNSATARAGAAVAQAPGITLPTPLMDVGPLASLLAAPPSAAPGLLAPQYGMIGPLASAASEGQLHLRLRAMQLRQEQQCMLGYRGQSTLDSHRRSIIANPLFAGGPSAAELSAGSGDDAGAGCLRQQTLDWGWAASSNGASSALCGPPAAMASPRATASLHAGGAHAAVPGQPVSRSTIPLPAADAAVRLAAARAALAERTQRVLMLQQQQLRLLQQLEGGTSCATPQEARHSIPRPLAHCLGSRVQGEEIQQAFPAQHNARLLRQQTAPAAALAPQISPRTGPLI